MYRAVIKLVKYLLVPVGAAYTLARHASRTTILMYHRVEDGVKKELSVKRSDFRWQMEYLKKHRYSVIPLDEAIRRRYAGVPSRRSVVLTFDDGYEDFYRNAFPVLREFGYAATVYIVPGYVESGKTFYWDGDLGVSELMNWAQIDELNGSGIVQFGSHTMSHADLNRLAREEIAQELKQSKEALALRLGGEVKHFAYPRGIVTREAMETARGLYETAVSIFDGDELSARGLCDPMNIRRTPVQRSDGRRLFRARLMGWLAPEGWLKKAAGRH
jgi:peptidoglycan/xylan/chitin deacetylase (PgdA/CDA1 family)